MWRHAKIGNEEMFYASLPGPPAVKEGKEPSKTAKHVNGYRNRSFLHLYGVGNLDVETRAKNGTRRNMYIAFHHYPKDYRQTLHDASKNSKKMFKWRVPLDVGRQCNPPLTNADLCTVPDHNGECGKSFFSVPILSNLDSAYAEIAEKEMEYNERLKALNLFVTEPVVVRGRKSPKERQIDIKEKDAKTNPRAVALRLQDREDEIDMLRAEIKKLKQAAAENEKHHTADLEMLNEIVTNQLMSTGLNRLSMLSETYHNNKPWLSKYLFGRTWKQHLDLAEILFETKPTAVVTLEGQITEFEKYCICAMIARRGYTQHTAAAIYNVDRSSVSRYMKQWMPKLGIAGGDCSELDLVMNHNLFSIEYCKENNLPYMEGGVAHNL